MNSVRLLLYVFCFASIQAAGQSRDLPYLILVSFDGFRHDYVDRFDLPNFRKFIREGASASAMIPCYPSMTFPNHYSTVTGMYPGNHGLVDNTFFDRSLNAQYSTSDRSKVADPVFYGGKPIWKLAREAGIRSASYFWVGSEVADPELRPHFHYDYDGSVSFKARVEKVMQWLTLPESERPRLIMLYFSSPDYEAHAHGPWANETRKAVLQADSLLGYMMQRVKSLPLQVNVLLTSDHGLTEVVIEKDTYIYLDRIFNVDDSTFTLVNNGTHAHIYTSSASQRDSLFQLIETNQKGFKAFLKEELPEDWHYTNERVGDIFLSANYPHYMRNRPGGFLRDGKPGTKRGVHGYDPAVITDMHGIFYANGPNIRRGIKIDRIRNIDVYPLMAVILGLKVPASVDGDGTQVLKIYKK